MTLKGVAMFVAAVAVVGGLYYWYVIKVTAVIEGIPTL